MVIRKMLSKDTDAVMDMMRVFYRSEAVLSNGSDEIFSNDIGACISENPYMEGFVFENEDGELAGYSMIAKSFSTEFGKPCVWIEDIYVKSEYRCMGIGQTFFQNLFLLYPDAIFRLEVEKENARAISVYKKCGFDVIPYMEMIKK